MVNYPTSLDNDSTLYLVEDHVHDYMADHHNVLKEAIIAVQTVLGITGAFNFTTDAEFDAHVTGNPTAHHTPPVAGDFSHNSLANINAGDAYEHITQTQKSGLHTSHIFGDVDTGTDFNSHAEQIKAGMVVTGGGIISFISNKIKWTQRFIVLASGRGAHFSTTGFFDMTQPTSGACTVVGGHSAQSWSASGITIDNWGALYYILPIGSSNTSIPANYRLVGYQSDIEIPDHWIRLAGSNGDSDYVRLAIGVVLKSGETWIQGTSSMINTDHAESHAMATHTDDDTYNISTTGTGQVSDLTVISIAGTQLTISNSSSGRAGLTLYTVNDEPNDFNFGVNGQFNRYSFSARNSANDYDFIFYRNNGGWSNDLTWDWATGDFIFLNFPITPSAAPDADYEVANKKYVDDSGGGGDNLGNHTATETLKMGAHAIVGTDPQHRILMDPAADEIRIHPGDTSSDAYYIFKATTNLAGYFRPYLGNILDLGTSSYYWRYVWANTLRYKVAPSPFDIHDDLTDLENIETILNIKGEPEYNIDTFPSYLKNIEIDDDDKSESVWFDSSKLVGFSWGCIKQLHQKVKDQENLIILLSDRLEQLEKN